MSVFAGAAGATEQDPQPGVRIEYVAPAPCPSRERFIAEIGARTTHLRMAADGQPARVFRVRLSPENPETVDGAKCAFATCTGVERFQGLLSVEEPGGATSERSVTGESCEVVMSAVALVAALTVDPEASTAPLTGEALAALQPSATRNPGVPSTPTAMPIATATPTATRTRTSTGNPAPIAGPTGRSTQSAGRRAPTQFGGSAGVEALGLNGSNLGTLYGPELLGELELDGPWFLDPSVRFAPEMRLGFSRFEGQAVKPPGSGDFTWYRGELGVCPLRFALASFIETRPCVVMALGALTAVGTIGASSPFSTHTQAWFELGASALVDWRLVGPVGIEVEGGLTGVPLRNSFYFNGTKDLVFQAPVVLPQASLRLRVRFP